MSRSTPFAPSTPTKSDELDREAMNITPKWKKDALLCEFKQPAASKDQKKKLILDEDQFENTFLKCMVCQEVFDRGSHIPKVLPCQHNVCVSCLLEMYRVECEFRVHISSAFRNQGPLAVKITCPACRESIIKSENEIRILTTDVTLLELGEFIRASERCVVSFCHKHTYMPMNFYCETCKQQVCSECTARDHGHGHDVVGVETAVRETEPDITATLELAVTESGNVARTSRLIESVILQLDSVKDEVENDIFGAFDTFRNAPESRAEELIDMARAEIDRKRDYLFNQLKVVRKREAELNASRSLLEEARANNDLSQMVAHHKIIKKTLSEQIPFEQEDIRVFLFGQDEIEEQFEEVCDRFGNVIRRTYNTGWCS